MKTNDIYDVSAELELEFGPVGSDGWNSAVEQARAEYNSQILLDARREAKMTQTDVARKIGTTKSYVSRIEHGQVVPSATLFFRFLHACGMRVEIIKTVAVI